MPLLLLLCLSIALPPPCWLVLLLLLLWVKAMMIRTMLYVRAVAIEYCKDCSLSFCAPCKKTHLKPKMSAHHQFISLDEAMASGGGGSVSKITHCEKHPHQVINTYCHADKQAICAECVVDFHVGHQVERLANVVQGFKQEISSLVSKVFPFPSFLLFSFLPLFFCFFFSSPFNCAWLIHLLPDEWVKLGQAARR